MIISIIAAKAENNVIGKDNQLIWHLPEDMKFFKKMTSGHHVAMGRKTFESLGKPLPNRTNYVITRNKSYDQEGVIVVHDIEEAIEKARFKGADELFILGGGEIYRQSLALADRLVITEVKTTIEGDTYFPEIETSAWKEVSRDEHTSDDRHAYDYAFVIYEKLKI
jgi:dihydrofolate reductase